MRRPSVRVHSLGLAAAAAIGAASLGGIGVAAATSAGPMVALPDSVLPTNATQTGQLGNQSMTVEVVLQPANPAALTSYLTSLYTPGSSIYGQWLAKGVFQREFAPAASAVSQVESYLRSKGLTVSTTSSAFLLRATGSTAAVESAFATAIDTYRSSNGTDFFSNANSVSMPASLASQVLGVVGLSNTVRPQDQVQLQTPAHHHGSPYPSCETPYPTAQMLLSGVAFPYGYGGGPDCTGLTPSQTNSIYSAPNAGPRAQGAGATLAVFELSGYTESDIYTWAKTFYGSGYRPRLININVDGGPLTTRQCPPDDECIAGYSGDIEVDADLEQQIAVSPDIDQILVYNAPNDYEGFTELDEYNQIAQDDWADSISSSWGECEADVGLAYAQAENLIFEQMAAQGQSMFSAAGDTGAFDCIRDGSGSNDEFGVQVDDPASQPWVTSVGGTSLYSDNPGSNPHPSYPQGIESVWNVDNLCNGSTSGLTNCANDGAGGGGHSIFWSQPFYQKGSNVINFQTAYGSQHCALARWGQPCREVPDVSADADEYTPYTEYCTGTNSTSACAYYDVYFDSDWFGIGGTSLSSPLWSAIFADRDAYHGYRAGNANVLLYRLYDNPYTRTADFHDITGYGQLQRSNGLYYTMPGYDEATGIGTPNMTGLILG